MTFDSAEIRLAFTKNGTLNRPSVRDICTIHYEPHARQKYLPAPALRIGQESMMHHRAARDMHREYCIARTHEKSYATRSNNSRRRKRERERERESWIGAIFDRTD